MKRRGFLSTLLLPFLPTPDLPLESLHIDAFRVPFLSRPITGFVIIGRDVPQPLFPLQARNLKGVKKLQLETK